MTVCCVVFTALSLMSADLTSTARFTAADRPEANPLARPLVEGRGSRGEAVAGLLTGVLYLASESWPARWRWSFQVLAVAGHTAALRHNLNRGWGPSPPIMAPVFLARF